VTFTLPQRSYRARWSIEGFQAAWDRIEEGPTRDRYRLDFWPAPPEPEAVRRWSGTIA
jgi:hypothetical protein